MDGIDVCAARMHATGQDIELAPLGYLEIAYPESLRQGLLAALPPGKTSAEDMTKLDTGVGQAFAAAAEAGIQQLTDGHADLVASLGQTIFHWIEDGTARGTLQLGQPAWIAERTGLPVVADLRARDIAAGGHGAPLASTLDALWLRAMAAETGEAVAALNIGGIANLTVLMPAAEPLAYDTGPGNALLDLAASRISRGAMSSDVDGALARQGTVRTDLLDRLLADPYYAAAPPKSTGKEYFNAAHLVAGTGGLPDITGPDLLATLTELTARTIAAECARHGVRRVIASGGGVDNPALLAALRHAAPTREIVCSDEYGLARQAKEAYLAALLGWLTWHGVPANLPSATGATGPRSLGSVTPGAQPLNLPKPLSSTPIRLRVAQEPADTLGETYART